MLFVVLPPEKPEKPGSVLAPRADEPAANREARRRFASKLLESRVNDIQWTPGSSAADSVGILGDVVADCTRGSTYNEMLQRQIAIMAQEVTEPVLAEFAAAHARYFDRDRPRRLALVERFGNRNTRTAFIDAHGPDLTPSLVCGSIHETSLTTEELRCLSVTDLGPSDDGFIDPLNAVLTHRPSDTAADVLVAVSIARAAIA